MKPEDIHKMDQASSAVGDFLPPYLRRIYVNLVKEGFTDEQSMRIILQLVANMRTT